MSEAETIARALGRAKRNSNGWTASCPVPEHGRGRGDRNPSLSVSDGADGKILYCCHGTCSQESVTKALQDRGLLAVAAGNTAQIIRKQDEWKPILPAPSDAPNVPSHFQHGQPVEQWAYRDSVGNIIGFVCRYNDREGKKTFRPWLFCENESGKRGWKEKSLPIPRPLYGLDQLAKRPDAPVLVVEGEKCVDAAIKLAPDHVVVTSQGGSNAASKTDWTPLKDRTATVWPDADGPGQKYAADVARLCGNVKIIPPPDGATKGWDIADALSEGWVPEQVRALIDSAVEPDNTEQIFDELAALSKVEYDRRRKQAASKIGIQLSTLDDEIKNRRPKEKTDTRGGGKLNLLTPDPWLEPVDGVTLVEDLTAALSKYLALEDGAAVAMALWIVHTHAFDAAYVTPRLALTSPEKRCGKTTTLDVLSRLVAKPLSASNISPAPLFRTVELARPTLLIDEADTFLHGNDELRGILNSGHTRSGQVIRSVGDDHEPRTFKTFAPVAIAKIGGLPDTLEDRSVVIKMRRKRPDEQVAKFRLGRTPDLDTLGRKAARWAEDNLAALQDADPDAPKELHDRAADNWAALFAIADVVGGEWPVQARRAALTLSTGDDADSVRATLLADIKTIFKKHGSDKLASQEICDSLSQMEDRLWPEWKNGKPMTPTALARQLGMFQIKPKTVRLDGGRTPKGYHHGDFADAFARYLPSQSATPQQPKESGASSGNPKCHTDDLVAGQKSSKPAENSECGGVGFQNEDTQDKWTVVI